jgi:hypothetical protein
MQRGIAADVSEKDIGTTLKGQEVTKRLQPAAYLHWS